jgi:hypothetical protein
MSIQAIHKGIEIEMEVHQFPHGNWKCDYTLIKHPAGTQTIHHGDEEYATEDLAKEHALQDARVKWKLRTRPSLSKNPEM